MTKDEIRALVVALEHQNTPLSRMTLRLLRELVRIPNRTEWVGEVFDELRGENTNEPTSSV